MPSLFISDLHLTEERPAANERFIDFLEEERAQPRRSTSWATSSSTGSATTTSSGRSTP